MLVLRRKVEERIVLFLLSRKITISILAVEGARVKIGISAPPEVSIVREELLGQGTKRNEDEQKTSAASLPGSHSPWEYATEPESAHRTEEHPSSLRLLDSESNAWHDDGRECHGKGR